MDKKGYEIKPLDESEYTDIEVNGFSSSDGLFPSSDGLSDEDEVVYLDSSSSSVSEAPIKVFSFNESEESSNVNLYNKNTPISHNNSQSTNENTQISHNNSQSTNLSDPNSKVRGLTPSVNGESFSVKRCYQFRPSTLKKLNQLKGESDNFNIYLNEIIDQSICYYHDYVFNKNSIN